MGTLVLLFVHLEFLSQALDVLRVLHFVVLHVFYSFLLVVIGTFHLGEVGQEGLIILLELIGLRLDPLTVLMVPVYFDL